MVEEPALESTVSLEFFASLRVNTAPKKLAPCVCSSAAVRLPAFFASMSAVEIERRLHGDADGAGAGIIDGCARGADNGDAQQGEGNGDVAAPRRLKRDSVLHSREYNPCMRMALIAIRAKSGQSRNRMP